MLLLSSRKDGVLRVDCEEMTVFLSLALEAAAFDTVTAVAAFDDDDDDDAIAAATNFDDDDEDTVVAAADFDDDDTVTAAAKNGVDAAVPTAVDAVAIAVDVMISSAVS